MASLTDLFNNQQINEDALQDRYKSSNTAAVYDKQLDIDSSSTSPQRMFEGAYYKSMQGMDTLGNLLGNTAADIAGTKYDNTDFKARSEDRGRRVARNSGFDEGGKIIQSGFIEDMPANLLGVGLGGKAFEMTASALSAVTKKLGTKSASLLVDKTSNDLLSKVSGELSKEVAEVVPVVGLNEFTGGEIDKEGKVTNKTGINDWSTYLATLGGEAVLSAVPSMAITRGLEARHKSKVKAAADKALSGASLARLNLDADAIANINKASIKGFDDVLDNSMTSEGFIDLDSFVRELTSKEFKESNGRSPNTTGTDSAEFEKLLASNKEKYGSLDKLKADDRISGAFSDGEGNFFIRTKNLGNIEGQLELSPTYSKDGSPTFEPIVDVKTSQMNDMAKYSAYDGKPIVDVNGYQMDRIKSVINDIQQSNKDASNMSEFEVLEINDSGKFDINQDKLKEYASKIDKPISEAKAIINDKLSRNKAYTALQNVNIAKHQANAAIRGLGDTSVGKNPLATLFTSKGYSIDAANDFLKSFGDDTADTSRAVKAIASMLEHGADISTLMKQVSIDTRVPKANKKITDKEAFDIIFNTVDNNGKPMYTSMKDEFIQAINLSYAKELLKAVDDNGNLKNNQISGKAIINGVFDDSIYSFKGNTDLESIKTLLAEKVDEKLANSELGQKKEIELDPAGERPTDILPAKEDLANIAKILGDTAEARATSMSEAFKQFTRDWSDGVSAKPNTKVKDPYNLSKYNKDISESAIKEASYKWKFTDDGIELINNILSGKAFKVGNKTLDDLVFNNPNASHQTRLVVLSGAISKVDVDGNMPLKDMIKAYDNLPDHVRRNIDQSAEELITEAKDLHDTMTAFPDGHHYATIIDNQKRVRYDSLTNPKTSKLAMMAMEIDGAPMHKVVDSDGNLIPDTVNSFKRGFLTNFGKKPERIADADIGNAFKELVSEMQNAGSAKVVFDEGVISVASVQKLNDFVNVLERKLPDTNFNMLSEIDGVTNAVANMNAQLGVVDPSTGIGSILHGKDTYSRFMEVFNDITGTNFSRSDVKSIVTGDFYLADHYTSTAALAEVILNKVLNSSAKAVRKEGKYVSVNYKNLEKYAPDMVKAYRTVKNFTNIETRITKYEKFLKEYTAIKSYFDDISKGAIDVNNYGTYPALASMKSNTFEHLVKEIESFKKDFNNSRNLSDIDLYIAMHRLDKGLELTEGQRNSFINNYTQTYVDKTTRALEKLYRDERFMVGEADNRYSIILKYRELNQKVSEHNSFVMAGVITSRNFIAKGEDPSSKITDVMLAANPNMDKGHVAVKTMLDFAKSKGKHGLSIADILEEMGRKGYLSNKVMGAETIQKALGNVETYAGSIPFYSFKGYAGYDIRNRTNFGSITIAGVHLPIQNIAYDAMTMAHMQNTASTPFLNKYDAIISDPVSAVAVAKEGNKATMGTLKYANPADDMLRTITAMEAAQRNMPIDNVPAATFMAQQKLMASQGKAMPDSVEKLANDILDKEAKSINDNSLIALKEDLASLRDDIKIKKDNLPKDTVVEQFTNGDKRVVAKADEAYKYEAKAKETDYNDYSHNLEHLKNVEKNDAPIGYLRDGTVRSGVATTNPVTKIEFDPNLDVAAKITDDGIIIIKGTKDSAINDINILETIYHEPGHNIIKHSGSTFDDIADLMNTVMTRESWTVTDMDGNIIGDALKGDIASDEYLVKVLGIIKMNEAIKAQPNQIAHRFNKTNLYSDIKVLHIGEHKVVTTSDLKKALRNYDVEGLDINKEVALGQLSKYEVDLAGAVNSSYSIRNILTKSEYAEFSPTFKNTWGNLAKSRDKIVDINKRIQTVPALELFQVDASREAMEKILSLKNGMQNDMQMTTASAVEDMFSLIQEAGVENFSKHIGRMELAGFSVLLKELDNTQGINGFKEAIVSRLRTISKSFEDDLAASGVSKQDLDGYVERLATGKYNPVKTNKNKMARELLSRMYDSQTKIDEKMPLMIEYFEKKSAYVRMFSEKGFTGPKHAKAMKQAIELFGNNPEAKRVAIEAMTLNNRFSGKNELFNGNIEINPNNLGKKLILTKELPESEQYIAKQLDAKGNEQYVIEVTDNSYHLWDQSAQIINPDLTMAEQPFYRVGKAKHQVFLNAQNILKASDTIDTDFTQMYKRNYYNTRKIETGMELFNHQYQMLKQEGFIITRQEHSKLITSNPEMADMFEQMPKNNPVSQQAGIHYYNKKYKHYLLGSQGKDVNKVMKQFFGKGEFANVATKLAKMFFGGTKIMKSLILQTRLSSYVNSFMSSSMIYGLHANSISSYPVNVMKAKKFIGEYRGIVSDLVEAQASGNAAKAAELKTKLESHQLHNAFKHGIADTIRKDAGSTGTYGESEVFVELTKIFGKDAADRLKPLALDPSIKAVRDFGQLYDATELYPKVALYLDGLEANKRHNGMAPHDYAIQKVLMAFPTYNNLNPMLNVIDSFSPFTKYMANFPKMFLYTLDQSPKKIIPMHAAYLLLPPATFNRDNEYEDKLAESGFMKVGNYAWYYESAYPLSLPSKSFDDSNMGALGTIANFDFMLTAPGSLFDMTPAFKLKQSAE